MVFSMKIFPEIGYHQEENTCKGELVIREFMEDFPCSLSIWSPEDYYKQWRQGIHRILDEGESSALITFMPNPQIKRPFVEWWLLFREGDKIYIQSQHLSLEKIKDSFDPNNPYNYVPTRWDEDEDEDMQPQECEVSVEEMKEFLSTI